MKIDQKGHALPCEFQIREYSRRVDRLQSLDRLQFHNYAVVDEHIKSVSAIELNPVVYEWNRFLPFDTKTPSGELMRKTRFVGGFQEAGTQLAVHVDSGTNDPAGNLIDVQLCVLCDSVVKNPFEGSRAMKSEDMSHLADLMSR